MKDRFSFIDSELEDFLRDEKGKIIIVEGDLYDAERWLLEEGEKHGWTNTGIKYFNWSYEFPI